MKRLIFFCAAAALLSSCKDPLPIYFDKPIGSRLQGFDTALAGNYRGLEETIREGMKKFNDTYYVKYDKIGMMKEEGKKADSSGVETWEIRKALEDALQDSLGKKTGGQGINAEKQTELPEFCRFNTLYFAGITDTIEEATRRDGLKEFIIKFYYDKITLIGVDSLGKNHYKDLLRLGNNVLLTRYGKNYFLNVRSEYGWEILQMEKWEERFLSLRPLYSTSYDEHARNAAELVKSAQQAYPGLSPIYNNEKKIIGFKAGLNEKALLAAFRRSESALLLHRID